MQWLRAKDVEMMFCGHFPGLTNSLLQSIGKGKKNKKKNGKKNRPRLPLNSYKSIKTAWACCCCFCNFIFVKVASLLLALDMLRSSIFCFSWLLWLSIFWLKIKQKKFLILGWQSQKQCLAFFLYIKCGIIMVNLALMEFLWLIFIHFFYNFLLLIFVWEKKNIKYDCCNVNDFLMLSMFLSLPMIFVLFPLATPSLAVWLWSLFVKKSWVIVY